MKNRTQRKRETRKPQKSRNPEHKRRDRDRNTDTETQAQKRKPHTQAQTQTQKPTHKHRSRHTKPPIIESAWKHKTNLRPADYKTKQTVQARRNRFMSQFGITTNNCLLNLSFCIFQQRGRYRPEIIHTTKQTKQHVSIRFQEQIFMQSFSFSRFHWKVRIENMYRSNNSDPSAV